MTIVNSDPVLDLGDLAKSVGPTLRSALSTPLVSNDELVGVLTLYSRAAEAFGEDDRRVIEGLSGQIAYSFQRARDFDRENKRQTMTISQAREKLPSAQIR
jgi:GAF domain-containing protein